MWAHRNRLAQSKPPLTATARASKIGIGACWHDFVFHEHRKQLRICRSQFHEAPWAFRPYSLGATLKTRLNALLKAASES